MFNMIFIYRYCAMLEKGAFRSRTADFVYMFIFGGAVMSVIVQLITSLVHVYFFSSSWHCL